MMMGSHSSIKRIYTRGGEPFIYADHRTITNTSCNSFIEDPDQVVMDDDLQDPVIKHTYKNLPWVGLVLFLVTCVTSSSIHPFIERQYLLPLKMTPMALILSGLVCGNLSFDHIMRSTS
jgi:hypothetical protein